MVLRRQRNTVHSHPRNSPTLIRSNQSIVNIHTQRNRQGSNTLTQHVALRQRPIRPQRPYTNVITRITFVNHSNIRSRARRMFRHRTRTSLVSSTKNPNLRPRKQINVNSTITHRLSSRITTTRRKTRLNLALTNSPSHTQTKKTMRLISHSTRRVTTRHHRISKRIRNQLTTVSRRQRINPNHGNDRIRRHTNSIQRLNSHSRPNT